MPAVLLAACLAWASEGRAAVQVIDLPTMEIRYDDAATGLYGAPLPVGDSLMWFPAGSPGFAAMSTRGVDAAVSSFALQVQMKPGYLLEGVRLDVEGDWIITGRSTVLALGVLRLVPPPGPAERDSGLYLFRTGRSAADVSAPSAWEGSLDASLAQPTSFAALTLQTTLLASALPSVRNGSSSLRPAAFDGSFAFVDLKQASLQFVVSAVPEPASMALLMAGIGVIAASAARSRRR